MNSDFSKNALHKAIYKATEGFINSDTHRRMNYSTKITNIKGYLHLLKNT